MLNHQSNVNIKQMVLSKYCLFLKQKIRHKIMGVFFLYFIKPAGVLNYALSSKIFFSCLPSKITIKFLCVWHSFCTHFSFIKMAAFQIFERLPITTIVYFWYDYCFWRYNEHTSTRKMSKVLFHDVTVMIGITQR